MLNYFIIKPPTNCSLITSNIFRNFKVILTSQMICVLQFKIYITHIITIIMYYRITLKTQNHNIYMLFSKRQTSEEYFQY